MATAIAQPSINTFIYLGAAESPTTYTLIPNVGAIKGINMKAKTVDVTSHSTGVPWTQSIATLLSIGDCSFPIFYIPSDPTHQALLAAFTSRSQRSFAESFPDTNNTTNYFEAYVTSFTENAPVDGVLTADIVLSGTGLPQLNATGRP